MNAVIEGGPAFAHIHVDLDPRESILAEADAMASMHADLDMAAKFNGGLIGGMMKSTLGGESLFINEFTNNTESTRRVTLVQPTPGNIHRVELDNSIYYLQPSAYLASTPGVNLGVGYAGVYSWFAGEGLFRLKVSGTGSVWYGAYGELLERELDGETIVDSNHLVSYDPTIKLKIQLSGGLISSLTSGEGFVTRLEGRGKYVIQSRSINGLAGWMNPRI
jgi:uncharacterized protein (TIGR00266 family)